MPTIPQPTNNLPGFQPTQNAPLNLPTSGGANAPANLADAPQSSLDALSSLLELKYAGIPFPAVSFTESSSQDLAVHKYPNLDSARVELTGRNPSTYSCKGIFSNNIYPSANESWKQGELFPRSFQLVLAQLMDSSTYHVLQHPFLGFRNVVPVKWDYSAVGSGPRDGVYMDITWIETIGDDDITTNIAAPNSLADAQSTSSAIDTQLATTQLKPLGPPNLTFGQFFSKMAGTIRNAVAFPQQVIGPLNAQLVQVNSSLQGAVSAIATSPQQLIQYGQAVVNQNKGLILHGPVSNAYYYDKAVDAQVFNFNADALLNVYTTLGTLNSNTSNNAAQLLANAMAFIQAMIRYYQSLQRIETASLILSLFQLLGQLQGISATLFSNNRSYTVNTYVTTTPTTLFSLSKVLNNTIGQLLQLNSQLNKLYLIPIGTTVRYYQG